MELRSQSTRYVVKTANGYVGRMDRDSALTDSVLFASADWYGRDEAERVAERFNGKALPIHS